MNLRVSPFTLPSPLKGRGFSDDGVESFVSEFGDGVEDVIGNDTVCVDIFPFDFCGVDIGENGEVGREGGPATPNG